MAGHDGQESTRASDRVGSQGHDRDFAGLAREKLYARTNDVNDVRSAADDLGRFHQGVVGSKRHRAMSRRPSDPYSPGVGSEFSSMNVTLEYCAM